MRTESMIKVFNAEYVYDRAIRYAGEKDALKAYLQMIKDSLCPPFGDEAFPLQTMYYRYKRNIVVVMEVDGIFYCWSIVDGKITAEYDIVAQEDEIKEFFDECGDNVTVLENCMNIELEPTFDALMKYVRLRLEANDISSYHRSVLFDYRHKIDDFVENAKLISTPTESNTYNDMVGLLRRYLSELDVISDELRRKVMSHIRRCPVDDGCDFYRMFGLYLAALNFGLGQGRYLKLRNRALNQAYRDMLKEMYVFMREHPNIVEEYCKFMHLHANERANVTALLESEGLNEDEWGYIGNDVF